VRPREAEGHPAALEAGDLFSHLPLSVY
jgi:hypothetical protein